MINRNFPVRKVLARKIPLGYSLAQVKEYGIARREKGTNTGTQDPWNP